jgi:predicted PurR-regulated permease PerM
VTDSEFGTAVRQARQVDGPSGSPKVGDAPGEVAVGKSGDIEDDPLRPVAPTTAGPLGPPLDRRSPYLMGLLGAAGVATTYALIQLLLGASEVLVLIALALVLAVGLDLVVGRLTAWRLPRWAAVTVVALLLLGTVAGFLLSAIPPLVAQTSQLVKRLPTYLRQMQDHGSTLGRLDASFHLRDHLSQVVGSVNEGAMFSGLLGAGRLVLDTAASTLTVLVLAIYLLADMPRIRALTYRLIPRTRRPRAMLLGDEILAKVGGYILGNLITSLIAGAGTFAWLVIWHVPYPVLLSIMVALFDLVPVVGAPTAGIIVTVVALTVSVPVAVATAVFYTFYKLAEDYFLVPRIIGQSVDVPATATLVAVLLGGAALGIVGAVIAIPVAAAIRLLLNEVFFPRLDRT